MTQVVPLQQPLPQEVALQTHWPLLQAWPLPQLAQAAPLVPQVVVPEVWHLPLESQQPLGQEVASQTHCPCALHSCWLPQAVQAAPLAPQVVFDDVTQEPFEQHPRQLEPPQLQAPALQLCPELQAPQAAPLVPQVLVLCPEVATHLPVASQQPLGHDEGVQAQTPALLQAWPLAHEPQVAPAVPQAPVDCAA
jgi:hypothetical protein